MMVFECKKIFHEIVDLRFFNRFKYRDYIKNGVRSGIVISYIFVIITSFMNFVKNFESNIELAWPSVGPLLSGSMIAMVDWYFSKCLAEFHLIFDEMQAIIEKSMF